MAKRKLHLDGFETCDETCKWKTIWYGTTIKTELYWRDYMNAANYRDKQMKLGYFVRVEDI